MSSLELGSDSIFGSLIGLIGVRLDFWFSKSARTLVSAGSALTLLGGAACTPRTAPGTAASAAAGHWVAVWQGPPQLTEPRNLPPAPGLAGSTLRQTIRVSLAGSQWRFRVSNEFGDGPLAISAMRIAHGVAGRDSVNAASDVAVTFRGRAGITIAAGQAATSDVVTFDATAFSDLAVSMYVSAAPAGVTGHPGSRTTSYLVAGNHVSDWMLPTASKTEHWYLLSRADVSAPASAAAVVVLGNSIADGRGSGTDKNDRWPDNLARRLRANTATRNVSVLNAGIGGNSVVRGGLGPPALQRFERDVLDQPSIRWLIVSEGVNDIGGSRPDSAAFLSQQLIAAYKDMIARAHARGLTVYGATILPFGGSFYWSAEHEQVRQTVNAWIRGSRDFDAVIDFDRAVRDPTDWSRLRSDLDGGDHLHPNETGYRAMADFVDLARFVPGGR
jgi:lysophospholipase L1-like esterase